MELGKDVDRQTNPNADGIKAQLIQVIEVARQRLERSESARVYQGSNQARLRAS